ncbi:MAG: 30S ribosomal protein S2 [Gammaproteobacteria bacterium]|nr:30S ribosomal protein S2 [Gammaproteobacteria bacterium]
MANVTMRQMLEAGVHFGHQTRYWSPKMAPYIYGERNNIHIFNLEHSLPALQDASNFLGKIAAKNGRVLFVGTKRAARDAVKEAANNCNMPYVNRRWSGGLMTNFKTVKQSVKRLLELEAMQEDGSMERLSKKEALGLQRELEKLEKGMGGIKHMERLPDALFVVDVGHERIAVSEANKLGIPVVAVVDSNNTPAGIDYVIPGNDDAIRAIQLYVNSASDVISDAKQAAGNADRTESAAAPAAAAESAPAADSSAEAAPESSSEPAAASAATDEAAAKASADAEAQAQASAAAGADDAAAKPATE